MVDTQTIDLKVCGITSSNSIITAANNNIKSLGFASNNLLGPNTCDDDLIKNLIEECDEYKIESVLLSRYQSTLELVKQIDKNKFEIYFVTPDYPNNYQKSLFDSITKDYKIIQMGWWNKDITKPLFMIKLKKLILICIS